MWYIYTMEYYSATQKNETISLPVTWMDLEITTLSEVNHIEKVKYHVTSIVCGIF